MPRSVANRRPEIIPPQVSQVSSGSPGGSYYFAFDVTRCRELARHATRLKPAKRLGHSKASMTLDVYGHVLEDGQQNAATALGSLLFGGSKNANG